MFSILASLSVGVLVDVLGAWFSGVVVTGVFEVWLLFMAPISPTIVPLPPPLLLPEDVLFVVCEYVAKLVKCFVQMTKSEPTSILQSPSTTREFPATCVSAEQVLVISVNVMPVLT